MTKLTEEMVIARSRQSDLSLIKKLNCWGSDLSDVTIIRRMTNVEVLALSVNNISSLQYFENCLHLRELYLRKNDIKDIGEIFFLQNLSKLKELWLEENPCCDQAGPEYRRIILRALPNLVKLDNKTVTPEEVEDALNSIPVQPVDEDDFDDSYERTPSPTTRLQQSQQQQQTQQQQQQQPQQQQQQQQQQAHSQQQKHATRQNPSQQAMSQQHQHQNQHPQQQSYSSQSQQQQQYASSRPRSQTPPKENLQQEVSPDNVEECLSEQLNPPSVPSSPVQNVTTSVTYSSQEQMHLTSPTTHFNIRMHYHQFDRSPGSDHDSPLSGSVGGGYRERGPIAPSMSAQSMKEYYQSERSGYPSNYRHSQNDLTEWEEHQQHNNNYNHTNGSHGPTHPHQRRSAGTEREMMDRYMYRNGSGDWDEPARPHRDSRRMDGRFSDSASVVSQAVLNHYYHRRPVNRSSNLLSATLCLVKELDYHSLEVIEHAVRCRIDELSNE